MSALRKRRERDAAKVAEVRERTGSPAVNRTKKGKVRTHAGGPRPDAARLVEVERMWLQLKSTGVIIREIRRRFRVEERTVYNDLARVRAEYTPTEDERKARRDQHRGTLTRMLETAELDGDNELARKIAADLAKLDGLNEPDKIEHSGAIQTGVLVAPAHVTDAASWARDYSAPELDDSEGT